jgi:hypothetical protein
MIVDDDGTDDVDDDDLDLAEGAAAGGQNTGAAAQDGGKEDAAPEKNVKKSVRLAADGQWRTNTLLEQYNLQELAELLPEHVSIDT